MNEETTLLWICVLVSLVGLLSILSIVFFGVHMWGFFKRKLFPFDHPFVEHILHWCEKNGRRPNLPRYLSDSYSEYLQRRNEFWTSYGQIVIAALIIIVLSILLLTRTISAEAGLPILSGISGFAIAKSVSISKTGSTPSESE